MKISPCYSKLVEVATKTQTFPDVQRLFLFFFRAKKFTADFGCCRWHKIDVTRTPFALNSCYIFHTSFHSTKKMFSTEFPQTLGKIRVKPKVFST
jgi:hypothetical protein